jgi:hypothetical protein
MTKLLTYIIRLLILGAHRSAVARELGVADLVMSLPFSLPQPASILEAVSRQSKRLGYALNDITRTEHKGLLVRFKDAQNPNSEFEAGIELNVYYRDGNSMSLIAFDDGTSKLLSIFNGE